MSSSVSESESDNTSVDSAINRRTDNRDNNDSGRSYQPMRKLYAIWKSIRDTRNIPNSKLPSHSIDISYRGQRYNPSYNHQNYNYRKQIIMLEKRLKQGQYNVTLLMSKLSEADDQIDSLTKVLDRMRRRSKEIIRQQPCGKYYVYEENIDKENDKGNGNGVVRYGRKDIERLELRIKSLELELRNKDIELQGLKEKNEGYRRSVNGRYYLTMNNINDIGKFKGEQLLYLSYANKTINRLLKLLKSTTEYKQLASMAYYIKTLHYLQHMPKQPKNNIIVQGNHSNHSQPKKLCSCLYSRIDERLFWTPATAYRVMLYQKMKYETLNEYCIEYVLFELNRIYLAKEEIRVKRLKEGHYLECGKLRKRLEEKYDELLAKKQIMRLKKELKAKSVGKCKYPKLYQLKNAGQYEDELRLKNKEIRLLQERVKLMYGQNSGYDRTLYFEGALWIVDKVLAELENNECGLKYFEVQFRKRIDENVDVEDWLRSYKEFFERLEEGNRQLLDRMLMIKESTLRKMGGGNG